MAEKNLFVVGWLVVFCFLFLCVVENLSQKGSQDEPSHNSFNYF